MIIHTPSAYKRRERYGDHDDATASSHEINSDEINCHQINSHEINLSQDQLSQDHLPRNQLNFIRLKKGYFEHLTESYGMQINQYNTSILQTSKKVKCFRDVSFTRLGAKGRATSVGEAVDVTCTEHNHPQDPGIK